VTGSAKAPIGGLSNLTFKVQKNGASDSNSLPQASTCFNILLLPPYLTLTKLRERLTTAIQETEGFGMK
jgi:ubiquitin-protein ligase E3 A